MKKVIFLFLVVAVSPFLNACKTTESATSTGTNAGAAAVGQKCSQCDCKAYSPGRLIKDVCKDCGHTAAEHSVH